MGQRCFKAMIDGIQIIPLKQIKDQRGMVMHMMRSDSPWFTSFGEIYFSLVNPGVVKAWKRHHRMTQNITVVEGALELVLYDDRTESPTHGHLDKVKISRTQYCLVQIPPMIWYGFKAIGGSHSVIANCTDMLHDPTESDSLDASLIMHQWDD